MAGKKDLRLANIELYGFNRIKELMREVAESDEKGACVSALAHLTEISAKTIANWWDEVSLPSFAHLAIVCAKTGKSLEWLSGVGSLDITTTRVADDAKFDMALADLVSSAKEELWVQCRAGRLLLGMKPIVREQLSEKIKNGLKMTLVIADPRDERIVELISEGRGNQRATVNGVKGNIDELIQLVNRGPNSQVFLVRFLCSNYLFFSNPENENGKVLSLEANFQGTSFRDAPMVYTERSMNPVVFNYYYEDFKRLRDYGVKIEK